jgi:hypothetical protein
MHYRLVLQHYICTPLNNLNFKFSSLSCCIPSSFSLLYCCTMHCKLLLQHYICTPLNNLNLKFPSLSCCILSSSSLLYCCIMHCMLLLQHCICTPLSILDLKFPSLFPLHTVFFLGYFTTTRCIISLFYYIIFARL